MKTSHILSYGSAVSVLAICLLISGVAVPHLAAQTPGTQKWNYAAGGPIRSAVAIDTNGTIYFGCDDKNLYALSASGTLKWKFATLGVVIYPAIGPDGTVYVRSSDNAFYAVRTNGSKAWQLDSSSGFSVPAIGADGTIYVSADGNLSALNPDGSQKWKFQVGASFAPSLGADGTIYVGSLSSLLYALHPDGTQKWNYSLANGGFLWSSPWIDVDGTVYFFGYRSNSPFIGLDISFYAIGADGVEKYHSSPDTSFYTPGVLGQNGVVYSGYQGTLQATFVNPLLKKWQFPGPSGTFVESAPAVADDGTVYFGRSDGFLFAVNFDGTERWRFSTAASAPLGEPVIDAQGTVYIGTTNGTLYAVYGTSPFARTAWPMVRHDPRHTGAVSYPVYDQNILGLSMYAGLVFTGDIGSTYRIEAATALGDTSAWQPLTTLTIDRSPYLFIDVESTNHPHRFYRAIQLP